jgi:pyridoxine 5-phosphate synthase
MQTDQKQSKASQQQLAVLELGVNVDHVATLRQARGTNYPDPVLAAQLAAEAGADGITIHLREDRRHIQDYDLDGMMTEQALPVNLEMGNTREMVAIALKLKPAEVCLVPEKREELTTEGGLDVAGELELIKQTVIELQSVGIRASLFIDPDERQLDAAKYTGADIVELHTGAYADASNPEAEQGMLARIIEASRYADTLGLQVNAGHGLHYRNVETIARIPELVCLNIGHSIISRAVLTGMDEAVRTMKLLIGGARNAAS